MTSERVARWIGVLMLLTLWLPTTASAQRALVLQDYDPWNYTSMTTELTNQGVPFDVVDWTGIATVDPYLYTMIFVMECQSSTF